MNLFEGMSLQLKVLHPGLSPPSACRLRSRKQGAVQLSQDQLLELSLTRPEKDKPWREGAGTVARTGQTEPSGVRGLGEMKHQRMVPPQMLLALHSLWTGNLRLRPVLSDFPFFCDNSR